MSTLTRLALALLLPSLCNGDALNPNRIGWQRIDFRASKLFFTVDTSVTMAPVSADTMSDWIVVPDQGTAIESAPDGVRLDLGTDAFGRRNDMTLLINAGDGAAVQRVTHETGGRLRHRTYRFTDIGAWHATRKPANEDEAALPDSQWPSWSNASQGLYAYPDAAVGELITEPAGLLYLIGAADLDQPGDYAEILAYARKRVHRVHVDVVEVVTIEPRFNRWQNGQKLPRRESVNALRLTMEGQGVGDGDPEDEFEMLGLRGKLELLLDPESRAPLRLKGRAKIVGGVTLNVRNVYLR